ncbi:unnamed protein product [Adineta ricciae]|uniref:Uncharacterized protein n=1 Tax=Adineta ricciae TaxID=249248 RepID=A0A814CZU5_ADIRI|nr:unnamed protein product [Adineta ricciae]
MSHSLARKFDKIVSKLSNKHKDVKQHVSDPVNYHCYQEDPVNNGETQPQESILQRMKLHLGHINKSDHSQHPEGVPPSHVIVEDLKNSPFKGKET